MDYIISGFYSQNGNGGGSGGDIPVNHNKWVLQAKDFVADPEDKFLWDSSIMGSIWNDNYIWFEG